MNHDPFLAVVERALADAQFRGQLRSDARLALAAAGLALADADLAVLLQLGVSPALDEDGFVLKLVHLAREREAGS